MWIGRKARIEGIVRCRLARSVKPNSADATCWLWWDPRRRPDLSLRLLYSASRRRRSPKCHRRKVSAPSPSTAYRWACCSVFNQGEVTAAVFPAGGATIRFVREVGWGNAMRYMLTGADWGTDDAYRMGLVQEVTPPGQELGRAVELAKQIAGSGAPLVVRATLASARSALIEGEKLVFAALQPQFARLLTSEDRQEYIRSVQEKRTPTYAGR